MPRECVNLLRELRAPPRERTKKALRRVARQFAEALALRARRLRTRPRTASACRLPSEFDIKRQNSLRKSALAVHRSGHVRGRTRVLWTDWEGGVQGVACRVADALNDQGGAYAIEQTGLVRMFVNGCGAWDEEEAHLREYLGPASTAEEASRLRKEIWDAFSIKFASADNMPNTVICIPEGGRGVDRRKTLVKIELPVLRTKTYCVLAYNAEDATLRVNPHVDPAAPAIAVRGRPMLPLQFLPWHPDIAQSILT